MIAILYLLAIQTPSIVTITPRGNTDFIEPQVAIENDGHVYVAYGAGDAIFVSVSQDKGATFSNPKRVANAGKLSLGMRRGPRITAFRGGITISAVYGGKGKGADGDILTFRSTDQGETWSGGSKRRRVFHPWRRGWGSR